MPHIQPSAKLVPMKSWKTVPAQREQNILFGQSERGQKINEHPTVRPASSMKLTDFLDSILSIQLRIRPFGFLTSELKRAPFSMAAIPRYALYSRFSLAPAPRDRECLSEHSTREKAAPKIAASTKPSPHLTQNFLLQQPPCFWILDLGLDQHNPTPELIAILACSGGAAGA